MRFCHLAVVTKKPAPSCWLPVLGAVRVLTEYTSQVTVFKGDQKGELGAGKTS